MLGRCRLYGFQQQWKTYSHLYMQFSPPLRFASTYPHLLESNIYIQEMYNKLSSKLQYEFLDQNLESKNILKSDDKLSSSVEFKEFLNSIVQDDTHDASEKKFTKYEKSFSEKFQNWTRVSQLRVGYLMHIDKRIDSSDYLLKLIQHLCKTNPFDVGPHELTALMLLIYFKRDCTFDFLNELMNISAFQKALAIKINANLLSREEICAICLGLKKIENFKVDCNTLRRSLYNQLKTFESAQDNFEDFYIVTLLTTLSRGNMVFLDDREVVDQMLSKIESQIKNLNINTAVKLLTYSLTLGFSNKGIETAVFESLQNSYDDLEHMNLMQICNYISKQPSEVAYVEDLLKYLEERMALIKSMEELMSLIECFYYLSHISIYSQKFNNLIFNAITSLPAHHFDCIEKDLSNIAKSMCHILMANIGLHSTGEFENTYNSLNKNKTISIFTRLPAFITGSFHVDNKPSEDIQLLQKRTNVISKHHHKKTFPMALYVPQMNTKELDTRSRQLISCYRILSKFMGDETYVGVTRILSHFSEPDLVFGNIGGISLTIPKYLTDPDQVGVRKPPAGDWWVLVIGTRKSHDLYGNLIGQEASKIRQLRTLGYNPVIIPYKDLVNPKHVAKSLEKLLKTENVAVI